MCLELDPVAHFLGWNRSRQVCQSPNLVSIARTAVAGKHMRYESSRTPPFAVYGMKSERPRIRTALARPPCPSSRSVSDQHPLSAAEPCRSRAILVQDHGVLRSLFHVESIWLIVDDIRPRESSRAPIRPPISLSLFVAIVVVYESQHESERDSMLVTGSISFRCLSHFMADARANRLLFSAMQGRPPRISGDLALSFRIQPRCHPLTYS